MSITGPGSEGSESPPPPPWTPEPASYPPVFVWPPRPLALLAWVPRFIFPFNAVFVAAATLTWWLATPPVDTMASLRPGWMLYLLGRNLAIVVAVYGGVHLWLYGRRAQADRTKFNPRWPARRRRGRTFGNQLRENIWWTVVSGVPLWTAWEAITLWLFASGRIPWLSWGGDGLGGAVWFVALFPLTALWREVHFYATHRLIHWPPLYRAVHSLHHRNTNPGPWSGLSMHPVEHLVYFSALAVHWIVPSHPIHALANSYSLILAPLPGHAGFERFELGRPSASVASGGYAHYLHHKLFEVNYADGVIPLDRWFGSFHDGSAESDERLRARRRRHQLPSGR